MATGVGLEHEIRAGIDGARMFRDVAMLSQFERVAGTPGEEKGTQYLVDTLRSAGLPVEVFSFQSYVGRPSSAGLEIVAPSQLIIHDVITHSFSANTDEGGIEGEVAYVEGEHRLDFPSEGIRGKILLADGLAMPPRVWAAEQADAIAQIYVSFEKVPHDLIVSVVWGAPTPETVHQYPKTPIVTLGAVDGERLRQMARQARPLRVRIRSKAHASWEPQYLPIVRIDPTADNTPYLLVGGHYCSWYVGATDNATGDAALMELARLFYRNRGRLRRGVVFAWWPGHTHGRYSGSTWFCDNFWGELMERCVGYFNIDSPGVRHANLYKPTVMAEAQEWLRSVIKSVSGQDVPVRRPAKFSDESFWGIGCPSWCIYTDMPAEASERGHVGGSGGGWFWHTSHDTLDKADGAQLATDTHLFAACIARLVNSPILPFSPLGLVQEVTSVLGDISKLCPEWPPLESLQRAASRLEGATARLEDKLAGMRRGAQGDQFIDRCLMSLSRKINPVLYTRSGPYEQDLAIPTPLLPSLRLLQRYVEVGGETHAGRILETYLRRQANRVGDALRSASDVIDSVL